MFKQIVKDMLSRKWLAFVIMIYLSYYALMTDKITGAIWETIVLVGFGAFAGSNVYQKIKLSNGDKPPVPPAA